MWHKIFIIVLSFYSLSCTKYSYEKDKQWLFIYRKVLNRPYSAGMVNEDIRNCTKEEPTVYDESTIAEYRSQVKGSAKYIIESGDNGEGFFIISDLAKKDGADYIVVEGLLLTKSKEHCLEKKTKFYSE